MFGLFGRSKNYQDLNGAQFQEKIRTDKSTVVLDVRTHAEFKSGHIPGAINIDLMSSDFKERILKLDKNKTYLVYCRTGNRSGRACEFLSSKGYKSYNLAYGVMRWSGSLV